MALELIKTFVTIGWIGDDKRRGGRCSHFHQRRVLCLSREIDATESECKKGPVVPDSEVGVRQHMWE
jgi:hypothetical protein